MSQNTRTFYSKRIMKKQSVNGVTSEVILEDLRAVYNLVGSLSPKNYQEHGRFNINAVKKRFGGFTAIYNILSVPKPRSYANSISNKEVDADIRAVLELTNNVFSFSIYKLLGKYAYQVIKRYYPDLESVRKEFNALVNSSTQTAFLNWLTLQLDEQFIYEKSFENGIYPDSGSRFRFDCYFPEHNLAIEYDDPSHFTAFRHDEPEIELEKRKIRDSFKDKWCQENDVILYRFKYTSNWDIEQVVQDLSDLGVNLKLRQKGHTINFDYGKYIGVSKKGNKYIARAQIKDVRYELIRNCDEKRTALYREGWIKESGSLSQLNNFSEEELLPYGVNCWADYRKLEEPKIKSSDYCGVYLCQNGKYSTYMARITVEGKTKNIKSSKNEKFVALYREALIRVHDLSDRLNYFTLLDLDEFKVQSWEEMLEKYSGDSRRYF